MGFKKPTKEELESGMKKSLEELEKINASPSPSASVPSASPSPSSSVPSASPSPSASVPSASPSPSEQIPDDKKNATPDQKPDQNNQNQNVDWKKRYSDSSREAIVLATKNKELSKAIVDANNLPEPTDEEMTVIHNDWEDMTPTEQKLAKANELNRRKFDSIAKAQEKYTKIDEWQDKVQVFAENPQTLVDHPELEGKLEDFKKFASVPTRSGLEFEDLVLAFFGDQSLNAPKQNKGQMFETGSGGSKEKDQKKDTRLSLEEAIQLRKNNYPKFKELLMAGKIKNE